MSVRLAPYPEYKDPGVPWLEEVPAYWEVLPNRALFAEVKERNHPDEQMLSVTISKGVIRQQALLADSSKKDSSNQDKSAYKLVCPRDIAYNKMRAWQGAIGISDFRGIVSPAYVVVRLRDDQNPRYFHHLYRTPMFAKEAERWSYGITSDMWSLRPEHFKMIYTALPPLPEQSAIVRFIDHFDRRINWLIRAKRRLIELLNEQKQAVIHRAVTRGLNPNVRLKPSGILWLGEIPEHWEVRPLKQLLRRMDYGTSENLGREGRVRVLTMGHIQDGEVIPPEYGSLDTVPPGLHLERHDLLFNRTNSLDLVGKVGIFRGSAEDDITFASYLVRLRAREEYDPEWLNYLLNSIRFWAYARSQALMSLHQANLNSTRYGQMLLPIPPESERKEISDLLNQCVAEIRRSTTNAKQGIILLREYRTRLTADVVKGKLDVRGVELPKLDETEVVEVREIGEEAEVDETDDTEEVADGEEQ